MDNAYMFAYVYGIMMKNGTAHAWNYINELKEQDAGVKRWLESPYVRRVEEKDLPDTIRKWI